MTLKEMSKQYEAAARPIRERLRELRAKLAQTNDPEEVWHLKRRIAELSPMLTQMNDLAWMLDHYYEKGGGCRDERYGFNGKRKTKDNPQEANKDLTPDFKRRINRFATGDFLGLSLRDEAYHADSCGEIGEQEHRQQDIEACGTESETLCEILRGIGDPFPRHPNRNRRIT